MEMTKVWLVVLALVSLLPIAGALSIPYGGSSSVTWSSTGNGTVMLQIGSQVIPVNGLSTSLGNSEAIYSSPAPSITQTVNMTCATSNTISNNNFTIIIDTKPCISLTDNVVLAYGATSRINSTAYGNKVNITVAAPSPLNKVINLTVPANYRNATLNLTVNPNYKINKHIALYFGQNVSNSTLNYSFTTTPLSKIAENQSFLNYFYSYFADTNKTCEKTYTINITHSNMTPLTFCDQLIGQSGPDLMTIVGSINFATKNYSGDVGTTVLGMLSKANATAVAEYGQIQNDGNTIRNQTQQISTLKTNGANETNAFFVIAAAVIIGFLALEVYSHRSKKGRNRELREKGGYE